MFMTYDIEMNFAQICAYQWSKVKWCFGRVFYHITIVGFKNANINPLKRQIFYDFLKKLIFNIFRYFRTSLAAHTQIIVCVLFHVNMF